MLHVPRGACSVSFPTRHTSLCAPWDAPCTDWWLQVQHYELLTNGGVAIFEEATLPPGVREAFKAVCPSLALPPAEAALTSGSAVNLTCV